MAPYLHTDGISTTQEDRPHVNITHLPKQARLARTDKAGVNHPAPLAATAYRWDISGALAPCIKDSPLYLLEQSDSRSALDPQPLQLCVKGYAALHFTLCFLVMEQGPAVPFPAHLIAPYPGLLPTLNTHQDTLHCPVGHAEPCHIQEEM